jgi:hypothetical protein
MIRTPSLRTFCHTDDSRVAAAPRELDSRTSVGIPMSSGS